MVTRSYQKEIKMEELKNIKEITDKFIEEAEEFIKFNNKKVKVPDEDIIEKCKKSRLPEGKGYVFGEEADRFIEKYKESK